MGENPRNCIFCRSTSLSKEHVLPVWLGETLSSSQTSATYTQITSKTLPLSENSVSVSPEIRTRQGRTTSRKVRVVCRTCNGGWMSRLEEKTKPILTPLILGEDVTLSERQQALLATWIAKTTIINEYTDYTNISIPYEHRLHLMSKQEPPKNWKIWIASYTGSKWRSAHYHHAVGLHREGTPKFIGPNTQATMIVVGAFLFHCFSTTDTDINFSPSAHAKIYQIWPSIQAPLKWEAAEVLTDEQVTAMADGLATGLTNRGLLSPPLARAYISQ